MASITLLRRAAVLAACRVCPAAGRPVRVSIRFAGGSSLHVPIGGRLCRKLAERAADPPCPRTPGEKTLTTAQMDILKALEEAPRPMKARAVATAVDLSLRGSHFRGALSDLVARQLVRLLPGDFYWLASRKLASAATEGSDAQAR